MTQSHHSPRSGDPQGTPCWLAAVIFLLAMVVAPARADDMVLVENGTSRVSVMVAADAPAETVIAAQTLIDMIAKISSAKPAMLREFQSVPTRAIWVGMQPKVAELFPDVDFNFKHAEEILIACNGTHLALVGRDRTIDTKQVEFGTANAVYTFLQKYLHVRWLAPWPRDLWLDVIPSRTIAIEPVVYRFHPPFRERLFWPSRPDYWDRFNRMKLNSMNYNGGHAFTDWWKKYQEAHPDWFAMQADGKRRPPTWGGKPGYHAAKLCVSNPEVWKQWLDNAEEKLKSDPTLITISASPNDGGGFCVCEKCKAWDHPDGPVAGADRYVKFWNILARGLKERFPDRDVFVGAYAYSAYRDPPISEALEPNIAIGYVGHFPLADDVVTQREQDAWRGWAAKATAMIYRPNLFHYSGGWLDMPTVAMRRTIRDFRFLADNRCIGMQVDALPHSFAVQGVQYYLMVQLVYDPYQDGEALLKDYYHRAFGPAAAHVEAYFDLMEQIHEKIIAFEDFRHSSSRAPYLVDICRQVYTPEVLEKAGEFMRLAEASVKAGPAINQQRVNVISKGFDFVKLQIEIMHVMKVVRDSKGTDKAAVRKAIDLCATRDQMIKAGHGRFREHYQKRVLDHMGPPSEAFRQAAGIDAETE